ncbi:hypothetical protein Acr_00g0069590 [Actinidia rufa]|uniref:RNase H type-1 domain-containing protein n=1 Tax=Actinidia rufa TaxID=165716 RepID=A0A7J0DQZ3_9ERIC|nr:hypothetical protein Acr_00g0069590 [Actinidia rufa]
MWGKFTKSLASPNAQLISPVLLVNPPYLAGFHLAYLRLALRCEDEMARTPVSIRILPIQGNSLRGTPPPSRYQQSRFLLQQFDAICGNGSSQPSMHLRSRCLSKPSASSPLDNKARPVANTSQALDLEGLHLALKNKNKYCEFHRDHGHNTEDCFQLKEQIADLIKKGYLRKYVADHPTPNSPGRRYGNNRPTVGDIQVIHDRFGSNECSSSSKKKHARSAHVRAEEEIYNLSLLVVDAHLSITFNNDNLRGLHLPHDDALVVSAVIANFNVQRILVDNSSSADILFISAFDKMRIGLDKLHPFHTPLVGLGGNMMHPLGWIKLPVTLGTDPHQITIWQDFIVVDCPSPYNVILGHPNLGGTKAITSIDHLKMKFPTSTGVGEWNEESETAFQELKSISARHPCLLTRSDTPEEETPSKRSTDEDLARWILFIDGSSNQHGCGAGLVLQTPSGKQMEYAIRIGFKATNNKAKYEALLAGLRVAAKLGVDSLDVFSDSQPVVNQVPWTFAQWRVDILGPLPQAPLQRKFLIVAIDYFTKWIEVEPLTKINKKEYKEVHMERHHLPIWNSQGSHLGQCQTIRQRGVQIVLLKPHHFTSFLLAWSFSSKWTSRGDQQNHP